MIILPAPGSGTLVVRGSGPKNVIFLNGPNFLSECSKLLYQVSLRSPDSLVKKNWPEPTRWIRQSNDRGFMVGKVVGFYWFFGSMMSVVTQWLILFPSECSCVLILVSLWHPKIFIKSKTTRTHLLCPCCVHLMCIRGKVVGKVVVFIQVLQ